MDEGIFARTWAEIDLDALEHNYHVIKNYLAPGCRVLSIAKADAYGHGQEHVARRLEHCGVDWFGVASMSEAKLLRKSGIKTPILVFGHTPEKHLSVLCSLGITQTVFSFAYAKALSDAAAALGVRLDVQIKADTGMTRLGFDCFTEWDIDRIAEVYALPGLNVRGIFTHFASADEENEGGEHDTREQFARFSHALGRLAEKGIDVGVRHCCNSGGVLNYPEMHLDMVRPGILHFGLFPGPQGSLPILPTMRLKTRLSMIKDIPAGRKISYGGTFTSPQPMKVACLPIGYADGYSRRLSNIGQVMVRGRRCNILGKVCMDLTMIDVTDVPGVTEGDEALLFGREGESCLPVWELAEKCDCLNYEILCQVGRRVPRAYFTDGRCIEITDYLA